MGVVTTILIKSRFDSERVTVILVFIKVRVFEGEWLIFIF